LSKGIICYNIEKTTGINIIAQVMKQNGHCWLFIKKSFLIWNVLISDINTTMPFSTFLRFKKL
jgi:hypothetical protein